VFAKYDLRSLNQVTEKGKNIFLIKIIAKNCNHPLIYAVKEIMTTNTDRYYIDRVCSGKPNDFSFLIEKYKNMVFTLAVRMVKNREEAEEIAQDAFVKAYKSLSKFKGDSKFSTWLYRITYNSCLDKLKSQKRMIKSDSIDKIHIGDIGVEKDVLDNMDEKERLEVINNAISLLSDEDKAIITLFYWSQK